VISNNVVGPFGDNLVESIFGDRLKTNITIIIGLIDKVLASYK
jgi:hypothetical protein